MNRELRDEINHIEGETGLKLSHEEIGYLDGSLQDDRAILTCHDMSGEVWIGIFNGSVRFGHVGDVSKKENALLKRLLKYLHGE